MSLFSGSAVGSSTNLTTEQARVFWQKVFLALSEPIEVRVEKLFSIADILTAGTGREGPDSISHAVEQTAAKIGYLSRQAEVDQYPQARHFFSSAEIRETLFAVTPGRHRAAIAAARLHDLPMTPQAIPGIDSQARENLAADLLTGIYAAAQSEAGDERFPEPEELKAFWGYGFMLHVLQEVAPLDANLGPVPNSSGAERLVGKPE